MPPPIAARMAVTIDNISHGRFGVNIVTGWQRAEYDADGPVAGRRSLRAPLRLLRRIRHDHAGAVGRPAVRDFKGDFFQMDDCRLLPMPQAQIPHHLRRRRARPACASPPITATIISAAASASTQPTALRVSVARLVGRRGRQRRPRRRRLVAYHGDRRRDRRGRYGEVAALHATASTSKRRRLDDRPGAGRPQRTGHRLGTQEGAARAADQPPTWEPWSAPTPRSRSMLDEAAEVPGTTGVMLCFDDFVAGMEAFGTRIQPRMRSRRAALAKAGAA